MGLTRDEIYKVCGLAARCVKRREAKFKPNKLICQKTGRICEEAYRGEVNGIVMCQITLEWGDSLPDAVERIYQAVHVRLCITTGTSRRQIQLVDFHLPEWDQTRGSYCLRCDEGLNEHYVVWADTSL